MLEQGDPRLEDLVPRFQVPQYGLGAATLPRSKPRAPTLSPSTQGPPTDLYTAIKSYEPQLFSDSGHQRLELPLAEGQVVRVLGPPDKTGYYEAEVNFGAVTPFMGLVRFGH